MCAGACRDAGEDAGTTVDAAVARGDGKFTLYGKSCLLYTSDAADE